MKREIDSNKRKIDKNNGQTIWNVECINSVCVCVLCAKYCKMLRFDFFLNRKFAVFVFIYALCVFVWVSFSLCVCIVFHFGWFSKALVFKWKHYIIIYIFRFLNIRFRALILSLFFILFFSSSFFSVSFSFYFEYYGFEFFYVFKLISQSVHMLYANEKGWNKYTI